MRGTTHFRPVTQHDRKAREGLRAMLAPRRGAFVGVADRDAYDALMRQTPMADGVTYSADNVGGVTGWWCVPADARAGAATLYSHGGWFVLGTADAYRNFVGHIAARSKTATFIPDYRLAPEHPLPAAIDDVCNVYDALVERGCRNIAVAGDSAGGALTIELLAGLVRDDAEVRPVGAVLLSPVTDLTLSGQSWDSRREADVLFTKEEVRTLAALYLGGRDSADSLASPLFLDFTDFPPVRIHTGDDEMLLDDSRHFAQAASNAGVDVQLEIWEGMLHVFPASVLLFDAARVALDEIGAFIERFISYRRFPERSRR
jgi:monoterpene epsilon-lactone hydrolase